MSQYNDTLFRQQLPEFSDTTLYPPAKIEVFWNVGASFIDSRDSPCRALNGAALQYALNLMAAHLMTISIQNSQAMTGGGAAGGQGEPDQGGFITSAHIDEITVSKLAPPVNNGWQFWLASTPYGQQIWALIGIVGVGGFSVGGLPEREGFRKVGGVFW
jgi:hypothetical protein